MVTVPIYPHIPCPHIPQITTAWRKWDKAQDGNVTPEKVKDFAKQVDKQFGEFYKSKNNI
jgi:hypothetical protein